MEKNINFTYMILIYIVVFLLVGCVNKSEENTTNNQNYQEMEEAITKIKSFGCSGEKLVMSIARKMHTVYIKNVQNENVDNEPITFNIDLTKVSPMIKENVNEDVIIAAQTIIEAFLRYENNATIKVSGNSQRFLNDMTYVIHCTCPMFGAYTDFSEMSSYDETTGKVSWKFYVDKSEFENKLDILYGKTKEYLSDIYATDSEAMRAILLYYKLIDDLNYNYDLIGENFEKLSEEEINLKSSPYTVLVEKSGICTNIAQAYVFLCTQADLACGTVLHRDGVMHMWNIVQIDGKHYYCDPTWDANSSLKYFGLTAKDRESWAGEYSAEEGTMLSATIPKKYDISDSRFEVLREKLPVEISQIKVDKESQTITFVGYEYEYAFDCKVLMD